VIGDWLETHPDYEKTPSGCRADEIFAPRAVDHDQDKFEAMEIPQQGRHPCGLSSMKGTGEDSRARDRNLGRGRHPTRASICRSQSIKLSDSPSDVCVAAALARHDEILASLGFSDHQVAEIRFGGARPAAKTGRE